MLTRLGGRCSTKLRYSDFEEMDEKDAFVMKKMDKNWEEDAARTSIFRFCHERDRRTQLNFFSSY